MLSHEPLSSQARYCGANMGTGKSTANPNFRHGHSCGGRRTPEYRSWKAMKTRCTNTNFPTFKHYGGRGIRICDRWINSFENFFADMGPKPTPKHSLDRIDNNGNYEPSNCRWATQDQQVRNCRRARRFIFQGIDLSVMEWSKKLGIPWTCLAQRHDWGWPAERALTEPVRQKSKKSSTAMIPFAVVVHALQAK